MKKQILFLTLLIFLCFSDYNWSQPWSYDFGTSTGVYNTNAVSTTFFPQPTSGEDLARVGSGTGSLNMENQVISFGSGSYLRGVAPTGTSVNKFAIYNYTGGKAFTLRFKIRFGASDGSATGAISGKWSLFIGDGSTYTNASTFSGAEVFLGLQWTFGASGTIASTYRNSSTWTPLSGTPFAQGVTYTVDIYGNNTTGTLTYNYGTSQSVAANKFDLWIDGVLVGDELGKAQIGADVLIDSFMFYGESSTSTVANIFLDDFYYQNDIANSPLPVELTSFNALANGKQVNLTWQTATEVNNYGFEIERSGKLQGESGKWVKVGFVNGSGNSNATKNYSFTDNSITSGKYSYRLKQLDNDGKYEYSKEVEVDLGNPTAYGLGQNYPNPFNPTTSISYDIPVSGFVTLTLYNALGKEVAALVNESKEAGTHTINYNASQLSSGIYFYTLKAGSFVQTRKMVLLK